MTGVLRYLAHLHFPYRFLCMWYLSDLRAVYSSVDCGFGLLINQSQTQFNNTANISFNNTAALGDEFIRFMRVTIDLAMKISF